DLPREGHADQASGFLPQGPDGGRRDELARDRQVRLGLSAIGVVDEDELAATEGRNRAIEVHDSKDCRGVYQDYCKNDFSGNAPRRGGVLISSRRMRTSMLDVRAVAAVDPGGMREIIASLPEQLSAGMEVGGAPRVPIHEAQRLLIIGRVGSASVG